jgi:membrane protease YdiL (CAAX protease family)
MARARSLSAPAARLLAPGEALLATVLAAWWIRLQLSWGGWPAALAPAVWVYLPLASSAIRRSSYRESGFDLSLWTHGAGRFLQAVALVLLPFGCLLLVRRVLAGPPLHDLRAPGLALAVDQLLLVAVPEELFFRGYVQGRLRLAGGGRRTAAIGAIIGSAFLFALAHLLVEPAWLRAAVFFPGLLLGWLRERSKGLLAPAGFHWLSNLLWTSLGPEAG